MPGARRGNTDLYNRADISALGVLVNTQGTIHKVQCTFLRRQEDQRAKKNILGLNFLCLKMCILFHSL